MRASGSAANRHDVLLQVAVENRSIALICLLALVVVLALRRPAERARVIAEPGIEREIYDGKEDGDVEQPHPPPRQRLFHSVRSSSQLCPVVSVASAELARCVLQTYSRTAQAMMLTTEMMAI
jgi:hypothetical protein